MQIIWLISAFILTAIVAYLLGSVNFAIIITKLFAHQDIRDFGSGNAGMTNVLRTLGKGPAALTLLGDVAKGVAAVLLGGLFFSIFGLTDMELSGRYVAAVFVLLGHLFPLYYGFKGGKGIATCAGAIAVLDWRVLVAILLVFLVVAAISRYVSLGSICAAVAYPITVLVFRMIDQSNSLLLETILALMIAVIVIIMHRKNIKRLLNRTENKIGQKKKDEIKPE